MTTLEKQLNKRMPLLASMPIRKKLAADERAAVAIFYRLCWRDLVALRTKRGRRAFMKRTILEIHQIIQREKAP
jgi:hypothetical protein